jgi:hypothetical protein
MEKLTLNERFAFNHPQKFVVRREELAQVKVTLPVTWQSVTTMTKEGGRYIWSEPFWMGETQPEFRKFYLDPLILPEPPLENPGTPDLILALTDSADLYIIQSK